MLDILNLHRRQRRALLRAAAVAWPLLHGAPAGAATDAQALLAASDAVRNPGQPFRATVTLTDFEKGAQVNSTVMASFARTDPSGQFVSLLKFVQPERDAGKAMLKSGNDLWFYDPATKSSMRIAPQQRLMGQAANGDVLTVNFARDYKASVAAEETITDGEKRSREATKLKLTSASPDATYDAIELWIDSANQAPLKARFYAESGRLLKTAFYRKYRPTLGAERPTETVIIDGLDPKAVTIVRMAEHEARSLPLNWFQRDHLPRFNAD